MSSAPHRGKANVVQRLSRTHVGRGDTKHTPCQGSELLEHGSASDAGSSRVAPTCLVHLTPRPANNTLPVMQRGARLRQGGPTRRSDRARGPGMPLSAVGSLCINPRRPSPSQHALRAIILSALNSKSSLVAGVGT